MIKSKFFALIPFLLVGCQSPLDDMMNNKFTSIIPESPPKQGVGIWTGTTGPYLVTMKLNQDGTGSYCYSYGTSDVNQKIKFLNNQIYIQDGTKLSLEGVEHNSVQLNAKYYAGHKSTLYSDNNLKEASSFCADKLR